jgi:hypothetical protein
MMLIDILGVNIEVFVVEPADLLEEDLVASETSLEHLVDVYPIVLEKLEEERQFDILKDGLRALWVEPLYVIQE